MGGSPSGPISSINSINYLDNPLHFGIIPLEILPALIPISLGRLITYDLRRER